MNMHVPACQEKHAGGAGANPGEGEPPQKEGKVALSDFLSEQDKEELEGILSEAVTGEVAKQVTDLSEQLSAQIASQVQTNFTALAETVNKTIETRMNEVAAQLAAAADKELKKILGGGGGGDNQGPGQPPGGMGSWLNNPNIQSILAAMGAKALGLGGGGDSGGELRKVMETADLLGRMRMGPFLDGMTFASNIFGVSMKSGATAEGASGSISDIADKMKKSFALPTPEVK
ncbi:MAG: hypothetical protein CVV27_02635 [Candidatus Melainabacteria bacterium HGW-Melainabacteria-1]|nr:MAG: hypothetical protein CVV27_02635 [Candidatus Melainabacteria bacterium HGW-Melainabacteria-1]